jgi:hypothetical protein
MQHRISILFRTMLALAILFSPLKSPYLRSGADAIDSHGYCPVVISNTTALPLYVVAPVLDEKPVTNSQIAARSLAKAAEDAFTTQLPNNELRVEPPPIGASTISKCDRYPCEAVEETITESQDHVIFALDLMVVNQDPSGREAGTLVRHGAFTHVPLSDTRTVECPKSYDEMDSVYCRKHAEAIIARRLLDHDCRFHRK